jgi:hypothetical protein
VNTTAKVMLARKSSVDSGETELVFSADYADERNKEWAKYTPSLDLRMRVLDKVAEHFMPGQAFTLTFTPETESNVPQSDPVDGSLDV